MPFFIPRVPHVPSVPVVPRVPKVPISVAKKDAAPAPEEVTDEEFTLPAVAVEPVVAPEAGTFVSARVPQRKQVLYVRADGSQVLRVDGSRAWRNNNPGNIEGGPFATLHGAIGDDGRFAIFPDKTTGAKAVIALLRTEVYAALSLRGAINRYAPPVENDTGKYVDFVARHCDLSPDTAVGDLRAGELRCVGKAIEKIEGWIEGVVIDKGRSAPNVPEIERPSAGPAADEWMSIALREAALPFNDRSEWPDVGPVALRENPRILAYLNSCAERMGVKESDEIPWCAGFVNYCLEEAGYDGTEHLGARSFFWNKDNHFVRLAQPQFGAVAVFRDVPFTDPHWKNGTGHVGFVTGWTEDSVTVLGGNQRETHGTLRRDAVNETTYPLLRRNKDGKVTRRVEAWMMPRMA